MVNPVVRIQPSRVTASPGGTSRAVVTIASLGHLVERFRLEVVGDQVIGWTTISPSEIPVYPETDATATILFSPPVDGVTAGVFPFGVRISSVLDGESAVLAEAEVEIERVIAVAMTLTPVNSTGRFGARHSVDVSNTGNAPVRLRLAARDPDQCLTLVLMPEVIEVASGGAASAQLSVRARGLSFRGAENRRPFRVVGELDGGAGAASTPAGDAARPSADGAFGHRPLLSPLMSTVLALAVAGGAFAIVEASRKGPDVAPVASASPPAKLTAAATPAGEIHLTWAASDRAKAYKVIIGDRGATSPPLPETHYTWPGAGIKPGVPYCFVAVAALDGAEDSAPSKPACATVPVPKAASAAAAAAAEPTATRTATPKPAPNPNPNPKPASGGGHGDTGTTAAAAQEAKIAFTSPPDGKLIVAQGPVTVEGTARGIGEDGVWILTYAPEEKFYYLTAEDSLPVDGAGKWGSSITVGADTDRMGVEYRVVAVRDTAACGAALRALPKPPGEPVKFARLPAGCSEADRITLVKKNPPSS